MTVSSLHFLSDFLSQPLRAILSGQPITSSSPRPTWAGARQHTRNGFMNELHAASPALRTSKATRRFSLLCAFIFLLGIGLRRAEAAPAATISFDAATRVFRIDAADTSYVFGVNEHKQLESLYWGQRLGAGDNFPAAKPMPDVASFDLSSTTTPHEYVGWGGSPLRRAGPQDHLSRRQPRPGAAVCLAPASTATGSAS